MSGEDRAPDARPLILARRQPVTATASRVRGYQLDVEVGGVGSLQLDVDTALALWEAIGGWLHPLPVPQPTPSDPFPYPGNGPRYDTELVEVTQPWAGPSASPGPASYGREDPEAVPTALPDGVEGWAPGAGPGRRVARCLDDECREDVRDGRCWAGHDQAALAAAELAAAPAFDPRATAPRRAAA